jgi:hypothetical protein
MCTCDCALNICVGGLSPRLTALEIPVLHHLFSHVHICILLSLTRSFYHLLLYPIQVIHPWPCWRSPNSNPVNQAVSSAQQTVRGDRFHYMMFSRLSLTLS